MREGPRGSNTATAGPLLSTKAGTQTEAGTMGHVSGPLCTMRSRRGGVVVELFAFAYAAVINVRGVMIRPAAFMRNLFSSFVASVPRLRCSYLRSCTTKVYPNGSRSFGPKAVQTLLPATSAWGVMGVAIEARLCLEGTNTNNKKPNFIEQKNNFYILRTRLIFDKHLFRFNVQNLYENVYSLSKIFLLAPSKEWHMSLLFDAVLVVFGKARVKFVC